jgi:hypothetical protein
MSATKIEWKQGMRDGRAEWRCEAGPMLLVVELNADENWEWTVLGFGAELHDWGAEPTLDKAKSEAVDAALALVRQVAKQLQAVAGGGEP